MYRLEKVLSFLFLLLYMQYAHVYISVFYILDLPCKLWSDVATVKARACCDVGVWNDSCFHSQRGNALCCKQKKGIRYASHYIFIRSLQLEHDYDESPHSPSICSDSSVTKACFLTFHSSYRISIYTYISRYIDIHSLQTRIKTKKCFQK